MICTTVKTQAELDAALTDTSVDCVHIDSPRGVWLEIGSHPDKDVEVKGSASVRASGSASVSASDSASVRASDSASVSASDSASVRASDSASVSASGSASVSASGSASVSASGSASVRASGGAKVDARNQATVRATPNVAVHLYSGQATVTGGVLIDLTGLNLTDAQVWCEHEGVDVVDGRAVLHKAVDDDLAAGHEYDQVVTYAVGTTVTCHDWRDDNACGGGLHLSPTSHQATYYRQNAARWLRCTADLADVRPIPGDMAKCKVRALRVEAEVDIHGRDIKVLSGVTR